MTEANKPLTKDDWLTVGMTLAIISLAAFLLWVLPNDEAHSERTNRIGAMTDAQLFVKRHLKAPSTAKFAWSVDEYSIDSLGSGRWKVSSYVDAQNGFGSMIRSRWDVTLRENEDGSATLEHISIR